MNERQSQRMEVPGIVLNAKPVDFVSKRQLLGAGAIVGVVLAILLGAVLWLIIALSDSQQKQITDNANRVEDIARVVDRLNIITHPTPEEYRRQLREGIRRCLTEPTCRSLFPRLKGRVRGVVDGAGTSSRGTPHDSVIVPPPISIVRQTPKHLPPKKKSTVKRKKAAKPKSPPAQGASSPPSNDEPVVGVKTPLVPGSVCTKVVGVNC